MKKAAPKDGLRFGLVGPNYLGMEPDLLSLQIAGGILFAAAVILGLRLAIKLWQMGYPTGALSIGGICLFTWIAILYPVLGLAPW